MSILPIVGSFMDFRPDTLPWVMGDAVLKKSINFLFYNDFFTMRTVHGVLAQGA